VVFGNGAGAMKDGTAFAATQTLSSGSKPIDGTNGARFDLPTTDGGSASGVFAGDLNGDGKADLIMGADAATTVAGTLAGKIYIFPGKASPWTNPYTVDNICPGC
jgi:hypothetical protein